MSHAERNMFVNGGEVKCLVMTVWRGDEGLSRRSWAHPRGDMILWGTRSRSTIGVDNSGVFTHNIISTLRYAHDHIDKPPSPRHIDSTRHLTRSDPHLSSWMKMRNAGCRCGSSSQPSQRSAGLLAAPRKRLSSLLCRLLPTSVRVVWVLRRDPCHLIRHVLWHLAYGKRCTTNMINVVFNNNIKHNDTRLGFSFPRT